MIRSILLTLVICLGNLSYAQTHRDQSKLEFDASSLKTLRLHNLEGVVQVRGTDEKKITMEIKRTLKTASEKRLEEAKDEIRFESLNENGSLYLFIQSTEMIFKIDEEGKGYYRSKYNGDNWSRFDVDYKFDIEIRVPNHLELHVSNHSGDLKIDQFEGSLYARNHHDDLYALDVNGNASLATHHGNIEARLISNPDNDCQYESHHGDIRVAFQKNLSAEVFLKSHHGEFFTEFDWQPRASAITEKSNGKSTRYVVNDRTAVSIGSGGPELSFATWHGDIYLLENDK